MKKSTTEEFIRKSKKIHGDKYNYSIVEYVNSVSLVKIICPEHGIFEQGSGSHLAGKGCVKCYNKKCTKTLNEFIKQSIEIHGHKYDYSLSEYKGYDKMIKIVCPEHGVFEQLPYNHCLGGNGCPMCRGYKNINFRYKKLYIFLDEINSLYKIGFSHNPIVRLKRVRTDTKNHNIKIVEIFDNLAIHEKDVHYRVSEKRHNHPQKHNGYTEWFDLSVTDLKSIINYIRLFET